MWPFRKVISPAEPAPVAPDPRQELLRSLRAIERELAALDGRYKVIRYRHYTMTPTGAKLCCRDAAEGQRVQAELRGIRHGGEILVVRRNAVLAALAKETLARP
jgi:hypothetical protein